MKAIAWAIFILAVVVSDKSIMELYQKVDHPYATATGVASLAGFIGLVLCCILE